MSLPELLSLLRVYIKRLIVLSAVCGVICFVGSLGFSVIKPSYNATATVVTSGGSFASVSGTANSIATQMSKDGVSVSASSATSSNTVTFTAKGPDGDACVSAANDSAKKLSDSAKEQQIATSTVVSDAKVAIKTGKSPVVYGAIGFIGALFCAIAFYVLKDSTRGGIHSPEAVAGHDLVFLGMVDGDESRMRVVLANFRFSGKDKDAPAHTVLLVPAGKDVSIRETCAGLARHAGEADVKLKVAPALEESVAVLYKGREADSVVVVVEGEISTFSDIDELVREFAIAGITPGGFVYVPYQGKVRG